MRRLPIFLPTVAVAVAFVLSGPAPLSGQAGFEGLVEVSEVLLDVLVTDADGNVVTGLEPGDFEVLEDGEEVPVTGLDFYTTRYGVAGDDAPPESRWIVLFFHDQIGGNSWGRRLEREMDEAAGEVQHWIDSSLLGSDWIAVVRYGYRLEVHQDFTQDRVDLLRAVESAIRGDDPPNREVRAGGSVPRLEDGLPEGKERRKKALNVHRAIRLVSEATAPIVGRKMMLLFSSGFGREVGVTKALAIPDQREYPPMLTALNDHNVAVYPIDWSPDRSAGPQRHFLRQLAEDTGGSFLLGWRDVGEPLDEIGDGNHSWYLLSYRTEHRAGEIGYREVEVRAANPDWTVQSRRGYRYGL